MLYSIRLASRLSCVFIYATDVDALLLAACIKDKMHLTTRNNVDVLLLAACIEDKLQLHLNIRSNVSVSLQRFASRLSCVFIYATGVDALLLSACIEDKLHLNIRSQCESFTPRNLHQVRAASYIQIRCGCVIPGLPLRQAAY